MISVRLFSLKMKLKEPLSISFHTWHYSENVLVQLDYNGLKGIGEAAPFPLITGDSFDDVASEGKALPPLPLDPAKDAPAALHDFLDTHCQAHTLKAAIDFAYHDLIGKLRGIPAYQYYRKESRSIDNAVTVFIKDSEQKTRGEAQRIFSLYPNLRLLKIKLKGEGDIKRVQVIKSVAPHHVKFILDANQGYHDPREAVDAIDEMCAILGDVVLVEEPCPKGELDKLAYVSNHVSSTMIFADESAATVADAKHVIDRRAAHGINIKLQKAGGIWPAKSIATLCDTAGLKVMVGCMLEGIVGITAGVHFAASTENVILTDLDMDLDNPRISHGGALFDGVSRIPSDRPGLGIELDDNALDILSQRGEVFFDELL